MTTRGSPQNECRSPQGYLSDTHTHTPTHFTRTCTDMTFPLSHLGEKKKWEEMDWGFLQKMPCFFWAQGGFFFERPIWNLSTFRFPLHLSIVQAQKTFSPMVSVILGAALHTQDYWKELLHSFIFLFFKCLSFHSLVSISYPSLMTTTNRNQTHLNLF